MADETTRTAKPHNRLTRLCDAMTEALDAHPERGDEKCIVFLQEPGDHGLGGLQLHGYEDDREAITDLVIHLRAILKSRGIELHIASLGQG